MLHFQSWSLFKSIHMLSATVNVCLPRSACSCVWTGAGVSLGLTAFIQAEERNNKKKTVQGRCWCREGQPFVCSLFLSLWYTVHTRLHNLTVQDHSPSFACPLRRSRAQSERWLRRLKSWSQGTFFQRKYAEEEALGAGLVHHPRKVEWRSFFYHFGSFWLHQ